jgi:hypothetical protein
MSKAHPKTCEHCGAELSMFEIDNTYYCEECGKAVAVVCPLCGGEGFMQEDEMECDWINYGDDLVTCHECNGYGWTAEPSFG